MTPAGVIFILVAIPYALGAAFTPGLGWRITFAIVCLLLVDTGVRTIFRWRGWRASAGAIAWLMIVFGVGFALTQLVGALNGTVYGPAAIESSGTALMVAALGGFVLWARRREPRPS